MTGRYIPALRYHWLTGFYDRFIGAAMPERRFKVALIAQAVLRPGHAVLDFGCGTGTMTLMIRAAEPGAEVVGVDIDRKALAIAAGKLGASAAGIRFEPLVSGDLPFPDGRFNRVLSSLVFHHLTRDEKKRALAECRRVLKPGGELHIADWGSANSLPLRLGFYLTQLLDGFETTSDHAAGLLPTLVADAGFVAVEETAHFATAFGSLRLLRAAVPL